MLIWCNYVITVTVLLQLRTVLYNHQCWELPTAPTGSQPVQKSPVPSPYYFMHVCLSICLSVCQLCMQNEKILFRIVNLCPSVNCVCKMAKKNSESFHFSSLQVSPFVSKKYSLKTLYYFIISTPWGWIWNSIIWMDFSSDWTIPTDG